MVKNFADAVIATKNLPADQAVDFPPATPPTEVPPNPPVPASPVTPPPPAPFNRGYLSACRKQLVVSDEDAETSDNSVPSRGSASPSPGPEVTPRGKSASSTQASATHGSRSVSEAGSKRGTRESPGPSGTSPKRARGPAKGKGKAREEDVQGLNLGGFVVDEDTPVDTTLVPLAAKTVRALPVPLLHQAP